jgi:hypothetical protein
MTSSVQTGPYRKHVHAYIINCGTDASVTNWQINKRTVGSAENAMWSRLTSASGEPGTWSVAQIRVSHIRVVFNNRAGAVTGGSGSVGFSTTPRVSACLVPFTEAELGSDLIPAIEDFTGRPLSLTARQLSINIPVPPTVPIGNFGSAAGDTRLLIYQSGYNGKVSVIVTYQTMGWPNTRLQLFADVTTQTEENDVSQDQIDQCSKALAQAFIDSPYTRTSNINLTPLTFAC